MSAPSSTRAVGESSPASVDQFVTRRLERAGTQVKLVDLATQSLLVLTVVLGSLLGICVVDAWIISLGPTVRWIVLIGLVGYAGFVLLRAIAPLLVWRINPAYAARVIEQGEPGLKNSLLNYVFLRTRAGQGPQPVLEAVQAKAARDLANVSIEAAVDRSRMIQIGFALVAITLIGGLYKLFSPKDPFATIARVAAPFSDVQAPSRVRVHDVEPGSVQVYFGETIRVTAEVRGARPGTPVLLCYSTTDGQRVNVEIPLEAGEIAGEFSGSLATSESGIQQDLSYWVVAGDGRSATYDVTVRPSPTIAVTAIDLRPPAYTELPPRRLVGHSDFDAIEGTAVHLEAAANMPIAAATVELLKAKPVAAPKANDGNKAASNAPAVAIPSEFELVDRIEMAAKDHSASAEFRLLRNGAEPRFTHYRLGFKTPDGQRNRHEPVYAARIKPDMAPELEILEPKQNKIQLPANAVLHIRARAMDPDFRISAIHVVAVHRGKTVLQQNLPLDQPAGLGNVQGEFRLRPETLGLQPSDQLLFHVAAKDNRRSPLSDQPDPNVTRSETFEVTIAPPDPNAKSDHRGPPDSSAQNQGDSAKDSDSAENSAPQENRGDQARSENRPDQSPRGPDNQDSQQDEAQGGGGKQSSQDSGEKQSGQQSGQQSGGAGDQQSSEKSQPIDSQQDSDSAKGSDSHESESSGGEASSGESGSGDKANPSDSNPSQGDEAQANPSDSAETNPAERSDGRSGQPSGDQRNKAPGDSADSSDPARANPSDSSQSPTARGSGMKSQSSDRQGDRSAQAGADSESNQPQPDDSASNSSSAQRPQGSNSARRSPGQPTERPLDENSTDGERFDKLLERMDREKNDSAQPRDGFSDERTNPDVSAGSRGNSPNNQPGDSRNAPSPDRRNSSAANQADQTTSQAAQSESAQSDDSNSAAGQASDSPRPESKTGADQPPKSGDSDSMQSQPNRTDRESGDNSRDKSGNPPGDKTGDEPGEQAGNDSAQAEGQPSADPSDPRDANSAPTKQSQGSRTPGQKTEGANPAPSESQGDPAEASDEQRGQPPAGNSDSQAEPRGSDGRRAPSNQTQFPDSSSDVGEFHPPQVGEREHLDQTRKLTDLVLEYLKDQKQRTNTELLNEMNWTERELREFVQRWEKLKLDASAGDTAAEDRYQEALRSLGLATPAEQARRAKLRRDQLRDMQEDSAVSLPPEKFAEAFRDFSKGRAKADADSPR